MICFRKSHLSTFCAAVVLVFFSLSSVGADKPRFRFCKGESEGCKQPGRGYSMCERFFKALNSLPPSEPPPVCDVKMPPGFEDFNITQWEPMPIAENMRLIYDMEMFLVHPNERDYTFAKWRQYFPDGYTSEWSLTNPKTWRRVPYDAWLADYQDRTRKGMVEPRLSRVRVTLNERGAQDLVRYERHPGGDLAECRDNVTNIHYAHGGSHIFALTGNPEVPINAIHGDFGSDLTAQLLTYRGKGIFLALEGPDQWEFSLTVAMPLPPPHLPTEDHYTLETRCEFRLNQ